MNNDKNKLRNQHTWHPDLRNLPTDYLYDDKNIPNLQENNPKPCNEELRQNYLNPSLMGWPLHKEHWGLKQIRPNQQY